MFNLLQLTIKSQFRRSRLAQTARGFTLIELLVGLVLAFLVLIPLMDFLVGTMNSDRQEQAKVTSQQEIQSAIDYITHDLEEAVYIYDADGLTNPNSKVPTSSGIKDQIPPFKSSPGCSDSTCTPILVFWKRALVKNIVPVNGSNCTAVPSSCNDTFVYSLVGYYLITDHTDTTWSQAARIGRFEVKDGVKDPTNTGAYLQPPTTSSFQPFDLQTLTGSSLKEKMDQWTSTGIASYSDPTLVLVDYIDQTPFKGPAKAPATDICGLKPSDTTGANRAPNLVYGKAGGFYVCVIAEKPNNPSGPPVTTGNPPLAQIIIYGNALARIQNGNTDNVGNPRTKSFYSKITAQVRGRGFQNITQ